MAAIRANNITKSYESISVLDDLSFNVENGAIFGLLGPNGAGKTTTIEILTGVTDADSGDISVLGLNPVEDPLGVRSTVGILPEKESPPSFLTPREYFAFIGDVRDINDDVLEGRVEDWATRLDFTDQLDVLCKDLSRGQQQKVMLAQSLLHAPELVFIDEPLANLDPVMQERVKEFIQDYNNLGNTIVICTHHVEVAQELCSHIGILNDGSFVTEFDPQTLAEETTVRDIYLDAMDDLEQDDAINSRDVTNT